MTMMQNPISSTNNLSTEIPTDNGNNDVTQNDKSDFPEPIYDLTQIGDVILGPGAKKTDDALAKKLPKLSSSETEAVNKAKKYAMEQSIKMVLMKQTIAHQQLQMASQKNSFQRQQALALMCRVYIGSISFELREEQIRSSFSPFGPIKSINMSWDPTTQKHKGFAFVEYETPEAAQIGLEQMNGNLMGGRNIKVGRPSNMPQAQAVIDEIQEEAKSFNRIYIASIHPDLSEDDIKSVFEAFGPILTCKLAMNPTIPSKHKGYGFIEYELSQSAQEAISSMNLFDLGGQYLRVGRAITPPNTVIVSNPNQMMPTAAAIAAAAATAKIQALDAVATTAAALNLSLASKAKSIGIEPVKVIVPPQLSTDKKETSNGRSHSKPKLSSDTLPKVPTVQPPAVVTQPVLALPPSRLVTTMANSHDIAMRKVLDAEEHLKQQQEELQKRLLDDQNEPQTLQQQENMSIKGSNARHLIMQKLMRKIESKVVILRNMVGADEVDESLQEEIQDECSKFGIVERVIIYNEKQSDDDDLNDIVVKIFVEFSQSSDYNSSGDELEPNKDVPQEEVAVTTVAKTKPLLEIDSVNSAPYVDNTICRTVSKHYIDPLATEVFHNPTYEELYAPVLGPKNPFNRESLQSQKNTVTGHVEPTFIQGCLFETERLKYDHYGVAYNPLVGGSELLGNTEKISDAENLKKHHNKKKRLKNDDSADIEGYLGPWGTYVDQELVSKPSPELMKELEEYRAKKKRKTGKPCLDTEEKSHEEKSTIHITDTVDYQGRTFLHPPHDVGVNLKNTPSKCYLPKSMVHTWNAHTKGVATIRWFPKSAHLLLSAGMDSKVKLWEVYKEKRLICTYSGHRQAVRDVDFNYSGQKFLSASYDRFIKEWDTETGKCISRYNCRKVPYCVRYHPEQNKSNLFVTGTSSKKILCFDTRSGEIVQEYDRHLGAVNTITFVDDNRRFVTTSDDKSLRVWEWDIPVDMKYIADPTMHSMPSVTLAPNGKWLACQSMDNKIVIFSALNRYKLNRKKQFTGHMVAGYACSIDFSPDMNFLVSGDADGKCFIWDWKNGKLIKKWKGHDAVCISSLWHPHEPSKLVTASWDGSIKIWN